MHSMNDIYSASDVSYRSRWAAESLRDAIATNQVVVVTGARQTGKSTLLLNEQPFASWRYVTLDDFDALDAARHEPEVLWAGAEGVILDEVQKAPGVLSAVKAAIDANPRLRIALSGSANLLLMQHVSESLAGRAVYRELGPMTLGEIQGAAVPDLLGELLAGRFPGEGSVRSEDPLPHMLRGMMPRLIDASAQRSTQWWEGYVATYLERDLRQLSQVESLPDFRRVMGALALRQGQLLNQSDVARDVAVSQPTTHRYINLLETSSLLTRLPAYAVNRTKRIVKSPKPYWFDAGLGSFLAGHYDAESLRVSRETGGAFECLVIQHLAVLAGLLTPKARLHYWRTTTGLEIDCVLEHGRRLVAFEFKLSDAPRLGDADTLRTFMREYPETSAGVVVHAGSEVRRLAEKVVALPWAILAGGLS
jgi:predicted AAA+ superfamily ATPase